MFTCSCFMCLLSAPYSCYTTWETAADVNTKDWMFFLFHSETHTNTQTSWSVMRLKNVRVFCSLNSVCASLSSPSPQLRVSGKKESRSVKERVGDRSVDSAARCWSCEPKQQQWRWELSYSLLCCQQKIIIEPRNKKQQRGRQKSELHLLNQEERARKTTLARP